MSTVTVPAAESVLTLISGLALADVGRVKLTVEPAWNASVPLIDSRPPVVPTIVPPPIPVPGPTTVTLPVTVPVPLLGPCNDWATVPLPRVKVAAGLDPRPERFNVAPPPSRIDGVEGMLLLVGFEPPVLVTQAAASGTMMPLSIVVAPL